MSGWRTVGQKRINEEIAVNKCDWVKPVKERGDKIVLWGMQNHCEWVSERNTDDLNLNLNMIVWNQWKKEGMQNYCEWVVERNSDDGGRT